MRSKLVTSDIGKVKVRFSCGLMSIEIGDELHYITLEENDGKLMAFRQCEMKNLAMTTCGTHRQIYFKPIPINNLSRFIYDSHYCMWVYNEDN